jgi:adenine phosphoribosyltransferase
MPPEVEALVTPDGKAQALLHVVQRALGIPVGVLLRKERKSYLAAPVLEASSAEGSATTPSAHRFYLGADDAARLRGRVVAIVDDVVSSGTTIRLARRLLESAGVAKVYVVAVATEGVRRHPDFEVAALVHLPTYQREAVSP